MNTKYIYTDGLDNDIIVYYYSDLKEKLNSMIYYLNKCINSLNGIDGIIVRNYNIDENKVNNVSIESIKEQLKDRVSYLKNNIIPSINYKINSLK